MSLKKELLQRLNEQQLRELADHKGIKFSLTTEKKKYYENWHEKDKLVDIMTDFRGLSVSDIEQFLVKKQT